MSSKYGVYWQNKLDVIARLLRKAHRNGMSNKLDVSDIQEYGERDSWYGIVEVSRGGLRKGEMAHAKSLGRTILDNRILEPYGKSEFRITISTDLRLRIERLGVGAKTTLETESTLYPTKNEYMNNSSSQTNVLILIPCCKRKNVVPIEGRIAQSLPLRNIEPLRSQLLDLVQQTSHLVGKPENHRGILSPYAPSTRSIELYKEGRFYQAADRSLRSILAGQYPSIHVLIVSAFYGLVRLDEELKEYELQMGDTLYNGTKVYKFWQQRNLSQILQGYINHNNITHVWSL